MSHIHNWSLTLEWQTIDDSDALCPTAICMKRGCKEKLNWQDIERRLNESERTKARITELEAEIVAWEAKAAVFVDQGELVERLKAALDDIDTHAVHYYADWVSIPRVEYDAAMKCIKESQEPVATLKGDNE